MSQMLCLFYRSVYVSDNTCYMVKQWTLPLVAAIFYCKQNSHPVCFKGCAQGVCVISNTVDHGSFTLLSFPEVWWRCVSSAFLLMHSACSFYTVHQFDNGPLEPMSDAWYFYASPKCIPFHSGTKFFCLV